MHKMYLNKRGVALLQVLIISAVIAGLAAMILRVTLSRTTAARQTRRTVSAQLLIESCMAEVNSLWASKTPEVYASHLKNCIMDCNQDDVEGCLADNEFKVHHCLASGGTGYDVVARMSSEPGTGKCRITYEILNGVNTL